MQGEVKAKAVELLRTGSVDRVLGWKAGTFFYDLTPAVFETAEEVEQGLRLVRLLRSQFVEIPHRREPETRENCSLFKALRYLLVSAASERAPDPSRAGACRGGLV